MLSRRFMSLFTAALALGLALASNPLPAMAAGKIRIVDDDLATPGAACKGAAYATIADAAASFAPGQSGTIKVCPGSYTEHVIMNNLGRIRIVGMPGVTVSATVSGPIIGAADTARLTIQNITLDGAASGSDMVVLFNTSGVITRTTFQNQAGAAGLAAVGNVPGSRTLKATRNTFNGLGSGIETGAINGRMAATLSRNTFTGVQTGIIMQVDATGAGKLTATGNLLQGSNLGIGLEGPIKARISKNTLDGFQKGIVLQGISKASVTNNKVRSAQYGVAVGGNGTFAADSNRISGNTLEAAGNSYIGIFLIAATPDSVSRNRISNNRISDPSNLYTTTIGIGLWATTGPMDKTVIQGNKLTNMDAPYNHLGDTNTVIGGNHCTPASPCVAP